MSKSKRSTRQEDKNQRKGLHAMANNSKVPPRLDTEANNNREDAKEKKRTHGTNNDELDITV